MDLAGGEQQSERRMVHHEISPRQIVAPGDYQDHPDNGGAEEASKETNEAVAVMFLPWSMLGHSWEIRVLEM